MEDIILIPWNDQETFERVLLEQGDEIAAVITEPIMCNSGCIEPLPGFMESARELTKQYGIVLIFDEVITGFRLGLGGGQESLGITPDLVTLGKAVAGGLPLSAVGGRKELMNMIADNKMFHMGTFNGNPLCTAAGIAAIDYLAEDNGGVYKTMLEIATYFTVEVKKLANRYELPMVINQKGPIFHTMFTELPEVKIFEQFKQRNVNLFALFAEKLMDEGVTVRPSGLWYLSTEHTKVDIDNTLEKVENVLKKLK